MPKTKKRVIKFVGRKDPITPKELKGFRREIARIDAHTEQERRVSWETTQLLYD
ncbi:MAG: hypothetical protein WCT08_03935 [Patescibacteria group bacterium]|jgi:hypothetical protein